MPAVMFRFLRSEDGATAIEYGIIAALMGAGLILAFTVFGNSLVGLFGYVRDNATDAMAG